jgi:serine/threonine protein kinase
MLGDQAQEMLAMARGAVAPPGTTPTVVTALDDLEQGEPLGRGATSTVRLALSRDGRPYALKTILKADVVSKGESALARLYREKDLLASLVHPGIVDFHTTLKDAERLYFLLELLDGGELLWHLRTSPRQRLSPRQTAVCLGALLLPLHYMQEQGVLYRDLKPTNIMFTVAGRLKLVDFGHAKRVEAGEVLTARSVSVCGTPHYAAPETLRGEAHGLAAQLWALGVLLLELLSGTPPFWEGAERGPLERQILDAQPDWSHTPEEARSLAAALLALDPAERQRSFPAGYADVKAHPWFSQLDWAAVASGACVPDFDFEAHADAVKSLVPPSVKARRDAALKAAVAGVAGSVE